MSGSNKHSRMAADQPSINYYDILGIAPSATTEEIKAAYRARVARYHPDRNPSTHANAITALINEAWEVLGNPERRPQYDATMGFSERSGPGEAHQENDNTKNR